MRSGSNFFSSGSRTLFLPPLMMARGVSRNRASTTGTTKDCHRHRTLLSGLGAGANPLLHRPIHRIVRQANRRLGVITKGRAHPARLDDYHLYTKRCQFHAQGIGQGVQGRLAGTVGTGKGCGKETDDTADIRDHGLAMHRLRRTQQRQCSAGHRHRRDHIGFVLTAQVFAGEIDHCADLREAGIVDQHIQVSDLSRYARHDHRDTGVVVDIQGEGVDPCRGKWRQCLRSPRGCVDAVPASVQLSCQSGANAGGTPGNQNSALHSVVPGFVSARGQST